MHEIEFFFHFNFFIVIVVATTDVECECTAGKAFKKLFNSSIIEMRLNALKISFNYNTCCYKYQQLQYFKLRTLASYCVLNFFNLQ